jgi:hypothetical protein
LFETRQTKELKQQVVNPPDLLNPDCDTRIITFSVNFFRAEDAFGNQSGFLLPGEKGILAASRSFAATSLTVLPKGP